MDWQFTLESFDSLAADWRELQHKSQNGSIFTSPEWMEVWWQHFGSGAELHLGAVRGGEGLIGIAPLRVKDGVAYFIGSGDICDYLDFVVKPGDEEAFFGALLDDLASREINQLDLSPVRPDSTVLTSLVDVALKKGWQVSSQQDGVSVELNLPATWDEYLQVLTTKQRHELRRKLRRLAEAGGADNRVCREACLEDLDIFVKLFRESRDDKAAFLTPEMESFFWSIAEAMAQRKLLRLGVLEVNGSPAAAVMCFDYEDSIYLYNSGYDQEYAWLSVGLISKALCIQDAIQKGKRKFDFLRGDEAYKYRLGGQEVPLYRCLLNRGT